MLIKTICLNIATDVKPRRPSFAGREGRPKGSHHAPNYSCEKPNAVNYWSIICTQWPICQSVAYRTPFSGRRESGSIYSGSTATEEKKVQHTGAWVPRTNVLRYSCCQEQKAHILKCSAPFWLAKALKNCRGGALQKSILCCYFSSPSQPETVKPGTARKASPEGLWLKI